MSEPVAMLLRIVGKTNYRVKKDGTLGLGKAPKSYIFEVLGELMPDEWATLKVRLPRDLYGRLVVQLSMIARKNALTFPDKPNDGGQDVIDTFEVLTGLLERTPWTDFVKRW